MSVDTLDKESKGTLTRQRRAIVTSEQHLDSRLYYSHALNKCHFEVGTVSIFDMCARLLAPTPGPGSRTCGGDANHILQLGDTLIRLVLGGAQGMELSKGVLDVRADVAKALLECSELSLERAQREHRGGKDRWRRRGGHGGKERQGNGSVCGWVVVVPSQGLRLRRRHRRRRRGH